MARKRKKNGQFATKGGKKRRKRRSPKRRAAARGMKRNKKGHFVGRKKHSGSKKRRHKGSRKVKSTKKHRRHGGKRYGARKHKGSKRHGARKYKGGHRIARKHGHRRHRRYAAVTINGMRANRHMRKRFPHLFRKAVSEKKLRRLAKKGAAEMARRAREAVAGQKAHFNALRARLAAMKAQREHQAVIAGL